MTEVQGEINEFSLERFVSNLRDFLKIDYQEIYGNDLVTILNEFKSILPPSVQKELNIVESSMTHVRLNNTEIPNSREYARQYLFADLVAMELVSAGLEFPENFRNRAFKKQQTYVRKMLKFIGVDLNILEKLRNEPSDKVEELISRGIWNRITGVFPSIGS